MTYDRLRSARVTLGLSTADIANQLNLTVNIIERIETGQFADIAPIFIRGYIRSYAKLIKLPEDVTQEIVNTIVDKEPPSLSVPPLQTTRFIKEKKRFPKLVLYCLLLAILVAIGFYWNTAHHTKMMDIPPATTVAETTPETLPEPMPEITPTELTPEEETAAAQDPSTPILVTTVANSNTSDTHE